MLIPSHGFLKSDKRDKDPPMKYNPGPFHIYRSPIMRKARLATTQQPKYSTHDKELCRPWCHIPFTALREREKNLPVFLIIS